MVQIYIVSCVARCNVLQCVAVCCRVLQCVTCSSLQNYSFSYFFLYASHLRAVLKCVMCVVVYCSVLQWVAVYCNVLQCVTVRCSALQCVAVVP